MTPHPDHRFGGASALPDLQPTFDNEIAGVFE